MLPFVYLTVIIIVRIIFKEKFALTKVRFTGRQNARNKDKNFTPDGIFLYDVIYDVRIHNTPFLHPCDKLDYSRSQKIPWHVPFEYL